MAFSLDAGKDLTADLLQDRLGFVRTAYTPSWFTSGTQPSIGNGKLKGRYTVIGNELFVRIEMLMGSTTTFGTNQWAWTLPSGLTAYYDSDFNPWPPAIGQWNARDVAGSPAYHNGPVLLNSSATAVSCHTAGSSAAGVAATVPFTWASTDFLGLTFTVELA